MDEEKKFKPTEPDIVEQKVGAFDHKVGLGAQEDGQRRDRNRAWLEKMEKVIGKGKRWK